MKKGQRTIAQAFPPGSFIREELAERAWSQSDLARVIGRPLQVVNQIINGRKEITPQTALALGEAFGTGAEFWMNLEAQYRLWMAGIPDPSIAKRAAALNRRKHAA
jgi:HTH-type transcriptional regulator / antitoxin HigA